MGKDTGIPWTDHTFNMTWGCTKISLGCANCYADVWAARWGLDLWGANPRRLFGPKHWAEPLKWQAAAKRDGVRRRVFTSSMADVFEDHPAIDAERPKLWDLIRKTPDLDWQLLTKRANRIAANLPDDWGDGWPNVWLGVSVENQATADERIPHLLKIPAAVRFLSVEPLLGPVDLSSWLGSYWCNACKAHSDDPAIVAHCPNCGHEADWNSGEDPCPGCGEQVESELVCPRCGIDGGNGGLDHNECWEQESGISWAIFGGESGPDARPCDLAWIRDGVRRCQAAGVAPFVKQWGSNPVRCLYEPGWTGPLPPASVFLRDPKGGDPAEWPEDVRVREFPAAGVVA